MWAAAVALAAARPALAFGGSLAFFLLLNQALRQALAPHAERLLGRPGNPGRAVEQLGVFANHATSMVHVVTTTLAVLHMLRHEDGLALLHADPLHNKFALNAFLYPFSFGYVVYDTIDLFRTYRSKARSSPPHWMLIHHVALIAGGLFSCALGYSGALGGEAGLAAAAGPSVAQCAAQPLIMLMYTNEFNSLFMLNRVLLRLLGCRATGTDWARVLAYRANLVGFWLSFAWGRVWMSGQGVLASSSLYGERPVLAVVGTAFGVLFLAMNIGGGVLVWMRETAEYKGAQQETPLWASTQAIPTTP